MKNTNAIEAKLDGLLSDQDQAQEHEQAELEAARRARRIDTAAVETELERLLSEIIPALKRKVEPIFEKLQQIDFDGLTVFRPMHADQLRRAVAPLNLLISDGYTRSVTTTLEALRQADINHPGYPSLIKTALSDARCHSGIEGSIDAALNQIEHTLELIGKKFHTGKKLVIFPATPTTPESEPPARKPEVKKSYDVFHQAK